jgi:hypothetical protein
MQARGRRAFVVTLAGAGLAWAAGAGAGGRWDLLGTAHVSDRVDHDRIAVTAAQGDFESIKIKVRGRAVHFLDLKIHFGNGEVQDVALRQVIAAGGETREIDVQGKERVIRSVEFWYEAESRRRGRGARVELYGRH